MCGRFSTTMWQTTLLKEHQEATMLLKEHQEIPMLFKEHRIFDKIYLPDQDDVLTAII